MLIAGAVLVVVYLPKAFFLVIALLFSAWGPFTYLLGRLRQRGAPDEPPPAEVSPS